MLPTVCGIISIVDFQRRSRVQGRQDDVADEGLTEHQYLDCSWHRCFIAAAAVLALFGALFLSRSTLFAFAVTSSHNNAASNAPGLSSQSVIELLHSATLGEAVSSVAAQLGEAITALEFDGVNPQTSRAPQAALLLNKVKTFRGVVQQQFKGKVHDFLDTHTEAAPLLASVHLSPQHVANVLTMLAALTDHRVLHVGMQASRSCAGQTASFRDLEECLRDHAAAQVPYLKVLQEELLPADLHANMTARFRAQHVALFRNGALKASGHVDTWHAELEIRPRILQHYTGFSSSPVVPVHPINWFTIGAPVASTVLGLVFLSLMDLLPGTGGFPTNRIANYALWGLQGATTLGECLANAGFPKGVIYLASCIIDVMFLGLEVIWVFFDGMFSGLHMQANCRSYTQWPSLQGVCGNCVGLSPGHLFENRCDAFCESFRHKATFAASSSTGSCFPQGQYATNQRIPGDLMLCQCVLQAAKLTSRFQQAAAIRSPFPLLPGQQNRRLQASQTCVHDQPYILQIIPSNDSHVDRRAPSVRLSLGRGQFTPYLLPDRVLVDSTEFLRTRPLYLAQRPDQLELINQHTLYGYRRICLIHGAEITTIVDSDMDVPPGKNSLWVRNGAINTTDRNISEVPIRQVFVIAPVGNMSLTLTTTTTTPPNGLLSFSVEIVTSARRFAETQPGNNMTVSVALVFLDEQGSLDERGFFLREVEILPRGTQTLPFECTVVTFTADSRPFGLGLRASGAGEEEWGFRAVYFVDDTGPITLRNSLNGLEIGRNLFWIGIGPGRVNNQILRQSVRTGVCVQDVPYIIQIVTSNRSLAYQSMFPRVDFDGVVPQIRFRFGEEGFRTQLNVLARVFADSDEVWQSEPLFLPQRPRGVELSLGQFIDMRERLEIAVFGYRQIRLIRGTEVTSILDSANGLELGNNSFWIRNPRENGLSNFSIDAVRTIQEFSIAPAGNLPSTLTTSSPILSPHNFRLEIVTADSFRARTQTESGLAVSVSLMVPNPGGGFRSVQAPINVQQSSGTFECSVASLFAEERPVSITLESARLTSFKLEDPDWGYRSVFFLDRMGPLALKNSFNGTPIGRNDFWIGRRATIRRTQTFQVPALTCVHDDPYILQIFGSNHSLAEAGALFAVFIFGGGQYRELIMLMPRLPHANPTLQSHPLFLAQRPEQLELTNASSIFGYRSIRLIHGAEVTLIVSSDIEPIPGNNSFWIRNADFYLNTDLSVIPTMQTFTVPIVGNVSAISTTTRPMSPGGPKMFRLEVVTSNMPFAETKLGNNMTISATFELPDLNGGLRSEVITLLPTGTETFAFGCTSVSVALDTPPTRVSIMAVGTGREQWGYRALYFFNEQAQPVALLDSVNGAIIGENEYWIGLGDNVISTQVFQLTTTSTTTTMAAATTAKPGQAFQCPPYTVWPAILGVACGNCEALVRALPYSGRCDRYCASFGLECAMARDDIRGTCRRSRQVSCNRAIPNVGIGMLCTCRKGDAATKPQGLSRSCSSFAQWPQINVNVCGSCSAVVPLGVPILNNHNSCFQYCRSFQHICIAAALQGSDSCSIRQSLNCVDNVAPEAIEGLCTCVQEDGSGM